MTDQPDDKGSKARALIGVGAEMAGGAAGGALGFLFAGPAGAIASGAGGVAISKALVAVGNEIADRFLAPRESVRVGAALAIAADVTKTRLENGETPRRDEYIDDGSLHPPIEEVTEGLLIAAQRAYDEKRVPYIGRLLANLNFRPDLDVPAASWLTRLGNDVSYTQLCILRLSVGNAHGDLLKGGKVQDSRVKGPTHAAYLSEALRLHNLGLINFGNEVAWSLLDVNPPAMRPQGYGVHLYDLMELGRIPSSDLDPIRSAFS